MALLQKKTYWRSSILEPSTHGHTPFDRNAEMIALANRTISRASGYAYSVFSHRVRRELRWHACSALGSISLDRVVPTISTIARMDDLDSEVEKNHQAIERELLAAAYLVGTGRTEEPRLRRSVHTSSYSGA